MKLAWEFIKLCQFYRKTIIFSKIFTLSDALSKTPGKSLNQPSAHFTLQCIPSTLSEPFK